MRIQYPPVGIAHITESFGDLLEDRLTGKKSIQCAFITQPKPKSHLGTMVVLMVTYAIAKHLRDRFDLPIGVLIDILDNSPAKSFAKNGCEYSLCLSHTTVGEIPASDYNMRPILKTANWLNSKSGIDYRLRSYNEIQSQPAFRKGLIQMLEHKDKFVHMMSPSERHLRIRPVCDKCGIVDKQAVSVRFHEKGSESYLTAACPNCGEFEISLSDYRAVIDANTPIRTLLRTVGFISNYDNAGVVTVIVNGKDWAGLWMQRVYFDGLALLGYTGLQVPMNVFSPLILDESGAKLSKTIYLRENAYSHLDSTWVLASSFIEKFGEDGLQRLFFEVTSWVENPEKFFRNYSISYIQTLFEDLL